MRHRLSPVVFAFLAAVAFVMIGRESFAQVNRLAPSLVLAAGYDDNVFWAPNGQSDIVLRVTPGLSLEHESPRAKMVGNYNFDAEHYRNFSSMTNAFVRQSGSGLI